MSTVAPEKEKTKDLKTQEEQPPLSDVDAKVLQSLLEDQPDLAMEDNINRLLRKNEMWKREQAEQKINGENQSKETKYSSKVMQTVTAGPNFWNTIRAKAAEVLEQVGLAIANKIERDLSLSVSLGAFFLERAAKDTSRALKASAPPKQVFSIGASNKNETTTTNTLLWSGNVSTPTDLRQELNTPADEIKLVTQNIQDILAGNTIQSGNRLRFLTDRNASPRERSKRAYATRKKLLLAREKEILPVKMGRLANEVLVDGTWQMKEELRIQPAGYKTKALREGVSKSVQFVLTGAASVATAALAASKERRQLQLQSTNSTRASFEIVNATTVKVDEEDDETEVYEGLILQDMLLEGKKCLELNLQVCLDDPKDTWLVEEVVVNQTVDQEALQDVIMRMVLTKIDLKKEWNATTICCDPKMEMKRVSRRVQDLVALAEKAVGKGASKLLLKELVWDVKYISNDDASVVYPTFEIPKETQVLEAIKQTSSVEPSNKFKAFFAKTSNMANPEKPEYEIEKAPELTRTVLYSKGERSKDSTTMYAQNVQVEIEKPVEPVRTTFRKQEVQDVEVEKSNVPLMTTLLKKNVKATFAKGAASAALPGPIEDIEVEFEVYRRNGAFQSNASGGIQVEVISGDLDFNEVRTASSLDGTAETEFDEEGYQVEKEGQSNFVMDFCLRSLDVVFFLVEKTFTVILPSALQSGQTAVTQYNKAKQDGLGQPGWKALENLQDAARRY